MGEQLAKLAKLNRQQERPPKKKMNAEERHALEKIRKEAKLNGATLQSNGEGGLAASQVLGNFRRDNWRCKKCGGKKDITVHHVGGVASSKWLSSKGHNNEFLVTVCAACHDKIHNEARAAGEDSSQVTPKGDKGTYRDRGLPDANPKK